MVDQSAAVVSRYTSPDRPLVIRQIRTEQQQLQQQVEDTSRRLSGLTPEEYEIEYAALPEDVKQYFKEPATVRKEIEDAIAKEKARQVAIAAQQRAAQPTVDRELKKELLEKYDKLIDKYKNREKKYKNRYSDDRDPKDKLRYQKYDALGDLYKEAEKQLRKGADPKELDKAVRKAERAIERSEDKARDELNEQLREIERQELEPISKESIVTLEPIRLGGTKPVVTNDVIDLTQKKEKDDNVIDLTTEKKPSFLSGFYPQQ